MLFAIVLVAAAVEAAIWGCQPLAGNSPVLAALWVAAVLAASPLSAVEDWAAVLLSRGEAGQAYLTARAQLARATAASWVAAAVVQVLAVLVTASTYTAVFPILVAAVLAALGGPFVTRLTRRSARQGQEGQFVTQLRTEAQLKTVRTITNMAGPSAAAWAFGLHAGLDPATLAAAAAAAKTVAIATVEYAAWRGILRA